MGGPRSPLTPKPARGRFSAKRKREDFLRLHRGEELDLVSRKPGVAGATLSKCRNAFHDGGLGVLRTHQAERIEVLERKLGQVAMDNELLVQKFEKINPSYSPAYDDGTWMGMCAG